jgi:transcription factor 1
LIDVHPGACVWSSKLHDFLKPKRHVLMEPEMRYFEPFVKPLLNQPGSTYRHTRLVGAHAREYWDNYKTLLDDQSLVPDRPALMPDDPKLREIDTSILLTGNLWRRYPIEHIGRYADHTQLLLRHMTFAALTNSIFQRSGLVRMLWWAPESAKPSVLPTNIRNKRGYELGLSMGASIHEVVGTSRVEDFKREVSPEFSRLLEMDAAVLGRVERRMAEKGMKIPPGRQMPTMEAIKEKDSIHTEDSIFRTTCTSFDELDAAIEKHDTWLRWMTVELPKCRVTKGNPTLIDESLEERIKKYVRYQQSVNGIRSRPSNRHFNTSNWARLRSIVTTDAALRQINLEANYAAIRDTKPDPDDLAAAHDAVLKLSKDTTALIEAHSGLTRARNQSSLIEDIMAVEAQPETLYRDRRAYEPLQAHPHEFWPHNEITLLDLVPHTADLSVSGIADRVEGARICQELLKQLYHTPALSVYAALERLAPNAAQDLIPQVPEITDARKGGRLDTNKLPVRMITPEMLDGLVRAFLEWPFRPSDTEMVLAQSGEGMEDGEDERSMADVESV